MGVADGSRRYRADAALAVAVAVVQVGGVVVAGRGTGRVGAAAYALAVAGSLVLVAARRSPIAVLLVAGGCAAAYLALDYPGIVVGLPVLVAVYFAVRYGRRPAALIAAAVVIAGMLLVELPPLRARPSLLAVEARLLLSGWLVAAGIMAEVARQRAAYVQQVEQRAADAERTREETALRRATEERLRIARELHDSLTHSISIVSVQAQVAVHLARKRGEEVPPALLAIQEAARAAMRELRVTLDVLRQPGEEPPGGLEQLPELVDRVRSAGVPATVTVSGEKRALAAAVDRAAFRIVQEALTNVTRHAGGAAASVLISYGSDELTVQVDDDGRPKPDGDRVDGAGLTGMRERVAALGGRFDAGVRAEGGFTVRARLPLGGGS